jgi:hypothetical protein
MFLRSHDGDKKILDFFVPDLTIEEIVRYPKIDEVHSVKFYSYELDDEQTNNIITHYLKNLLNGLSDSKAGRS